MSTQHQQHPQPPQQPPARKPNESATGGPEDTSPTYTPLPAVEWAVMQSALATAIAAGKAPAELGVKAPGDPAEYPLMMYNKKDRTTKAAKDEKEKGDLSGKGYSTEPFPAEDPNAITAEMIQSLQEVWTKAGDALKKLISLVEAQQKQTESSGTKSDAEGKPEKKPKTTES